MGITVKSWVKLVDDFFLERGGDKTVEGKKTYKLIQSPEGANKITWTWTYDIYAASETQTSKWHETAAFTTDHLRCARIPPCLVHWRDYAQGCHAMSQKHGCSSLCNGYLTRICKPVRFVRSEVNTARCWGFSLMECDTSQWVRVSQFSIGM